MHTRARNLQKVGMCVEEPGGTSGLKAPLMETGSGAPSSLQWVQDKAQLTERGVYKCQYNVSHNIWAVNPPFSPFIPLQAFCISHLNS